MSSDWYRPAPFEAPKEDLGVPKTFTLFAWERMSPYMQNYWNRGGRHVNWRLRWEHDDEAQVEKRVIEAWAESVKPEG